jgi:hypothetical protein
VTLADLERAIVVATLEGRSALAETLAEMLRRRTRETSGNVVPLKTPTLVIAIRAVVSINSVRCSRVHRHAR